MPKYTIEVCAQFEVEAFSEEDACDRAVDQAMEIEPAEWGTRVLSRPNRTPEAA